MSAVELFEDVKTLIMSSALASAGDNLDGMTLDFDYYLIYTCSSLADGTITKTADPNQLLIAACTAHRDATPTLVAEEITTAWLRDLRYGFRETHRLRQTTTRVELDFATQTSEHGIFVTGLITVQWPAFR
ncbi:hypothetical protein QRX50_35500 [Amycolatopsis carbonis]|uniref:Uncharacterized protein n=1 Tax=Amycolatopsis carbonis TaxID=715471 RepID=A0A9Y2IAX3_9PSEU|nr:hypothetical protein [Amycolatopsis sp. 2-15]WIX76717.1 hypothetical protein QRX50_35500 [Amycolatopsis sp. 2-15]